MIAFFWFVFGAGFALLVVAAGVTLHVRRRAAYGAVPVVDDDVIDRIIEHGEVFVDDEPLDQAVIDDEEERFWSESWDEPTGDW